VHCSFFGFYCVLIVRYSKRSVLIVLRKSRHNSLRVNPSQFLPAGRGSGTLRRRLTDLARVRLCQLSTDSVNAIFVILNFSLIRARPERGWLRSGLIVAVIAEAKAYTQSGHPAEQPLRGFQHREDRNAGVPYLSTETVERSFGGPSIICALWRVMPTAGVF